MLVDTPAIVLKTIAFRESSLIVTLLSDTHGKIAVMARGARRHKNKYGGLLQPGSVLNVTYYYKTTRDVQNLSEVSQNKATWRIHQQMEKMAVGIATLELCEQLCHEHEPMPDVFQFLTGFLPWLHETKANPKNLFPYIQFRLADLIGVGVAWKMDNPEYITNPVNDAGSNCYLNIESGCISPYSDKGVHFKLTKFQLQYLRYFKEGKKSYLLSESFPPEDLRNLIHHMDVYFQYHMDGIKPRRSDAIFQQILN